MKFTERELTVAVEAVAKQMLSGAKPWRRGKVEEAWERLGIFDRYQRKATAGEVVLPVLVALPERPTVGARPEFSRAEYSAAAEEGCRSLVDAQSPGRWDRLSGGKRKRLVLVAVAMTRLAVEAMPVRQDPDGLTVPDHL